MTLFKKKHSNIFRMNGYTAFQNAKDTQNYTLAEISSMIGEETTKIRRYFLPGYFKHDWKIIIKLAEQLGVERHQYIKEEYLDNLPDDVVVFSNMLLATVVKYPKAKEPSKRSERGGSIRKMLEDGMKHKDIAAAMGIKPPSVAHWAHKFGLTRKKVKPIAEGEIAEIKRLSKTGCSVKYIASKHGRSRSTIHKILTDQRPKKRGRKASVVSLPNNERQTDNAWVLNAISGMDDVLEITVRTKTTITTIKRVD